jgi:dienelactone hydrolase
VIILFLNSSCHDLLRRGTPLERNTYSDIEAVYNYVQEHVANGDSRSIILYGQSVGSGPSCYLASKQPVGGLILHSPFTSGMRVLTPSR